MNEVETFEVDDKVVKIFHDEDAQNPRDSEYQDNIDKFICDHKRYDLGDNHDYKFDNYNDWEELKAQLVKDFDPVEIRPLYLYDHSGITISDHDFNDRWDSGRVGFLLMGRKEALKNWGGKKVTKALREKVSKFLDSSLKDYDSFLRGEVYGYQIFAKIEEEDGEEHDYDNDDDIESCWGFIGDIEYVKKEATEAAKAIKVPIKAEVENPNQLTLALGV